jgi:hypothetical protein
MRACTVLARLGVVLIVIAQGWVLVRPRPLPLDSARRALVEDAARQLAERLPAAPPGRPSLVVAQFQRDPTGLATDAVRRAIDRAGGFAVQPASFWENARRVLGIGIDGLAPEAAATATGNRLDGDYLMAGRLHRLAARSEREEAALEAVLVDARVPSQAISVKAEVARDHSRGQTAARITSYAWPARLAAWLALVVLLPLTLAPWLLRAVECRSNAVNLGLLLGLAAAGTAAALAVTGFRLEGSCAALALAAAAATALGYNWVVLDKMDKIV